MTFMFFPDVWRVYIGLKDSNTAPKLAQIVAFLLWPFRKWFVYFMIFYIKRRSRSYRLVLAPPTPPPRQSIKAMLKMRVHGQRHCLLTI